MLIIPGRLVGTLAQSAEPADGARPTEGSWLVAIATDATADSPLAERYAARALAGLIREGCRMVTGSSAAAGSRCTNRRARDSSGVSGDVIDAVFSSVIEATVETSFISSVTKTTTTTTNGRTADAVPFEQFQYPSALAEETLPHLTSARVRKAEML